MTLSLTEIKQLTTVDLDNFEIRGAKFGIKNSRTTGPIFDNGSYIPSSTVFTGSAAFTADSSVVTGIAFDAPYTGLNASVFNNKDYLYTDSTYKIVSVLSSDSVSLDKTSLETGTGTYSFRTSLGARDYLIESDTSYNTVSKGTASFISGLDAISGTGTDGAWNSVRSGDLIKSSDFPNYYYQIKSIDTDATLIQISTAYGGSSFSGGYIIKRKNINNMEIRYVKDNFIYEKNGGYWKYDTTTGSGIPASSSVYKPLDDGINIKFTQSLSPTVPDLVDSAVTIDKLLAKSTINIMPQFPLPTVPRPEENFRLYINTQLKDMFPNGNKDYVINYWQSPIYLPPPSVNERRVANLMFLQGTGNVVLNPANTYQGIIKFTDSSGNVVGNVLSGSETIVVNDTTQIRNIDYVFDSDLGLVEKAGHQTAEQLVKYVGTRYSNFIDYGLSVTLHGKKQALSFPPNNADDVKFTLETGRLKPINKDHPGPGDEYIVEYLVDSAAQMDQEVRVNAGDTYFRTSYYPISNNSVILLQAGNSLIEGQDFRVSYQTGRIVFPSPFTNASTFVISYTPLSKMVNGVSYESGKRYCTVYDSRLIITSASLYTFQLQNTLLDLTKIEIKRIYNETRNQEYDLTGMVLVPGVQLALTSTNTAIGLESTDIVVIDYKFEQDGVEYAPVTTSGLTMTGGTNKLYVVGRNAASSFSPGLMARLTPSDAPNQYLFRVNNATFDGEDTIVAFDNSSPVDIANPDVYVTDSSVVFVPSGLTAQNIESGLSTVTFNGPVSVRRGSALRISNDYYYVSHVDSSVVTIGSAFPTDYTTASVLSSIYQSDVPIYYEGDTEISASRYILDSNAPVMVLSYGSGVVTATSDTSRFSVIGTDGSTNIFRYSTYPTVGALASALTSVMDMTVGTYISDWTSSNIVPVKNFSISPDSSSLVSIKPSLRLDNTSISKYTIDNGLVVLGTGLTGNQRYSMDYLGLEPLGDSTVTYSASYFTSLPAGSEVRVSMEYDNLDQFYIQVMGQREFLETVIEPRVEQEAAQQSGNMGQGGDLPDDAAQGNSEGGLAGDEFRRMDMAIECRVDKNIFDYFNDRAGAYGQEMYSMTGWKLCNNDGLLSETDQSAGTRSFNRMYPDADYTNFEPAFVNPLTGRAIPPSTTAIFTSGRTDVTCKSVDFGVQSKWLTQLRTGDQIRRVDTTDVYTISGITSDTSMGLTQAFTGTSSADPDGSLFEMYSAYSPYDDDGHVGAKLHSNRLDHYGLKDGDVFDIYLDSSHQSYTFQNPTDPIGLLFYPLSKYTAQNVADLFNSYFNGLEATVGWVLRPYGYGYTNALVLRTANDSTFNCLTMGNGNAVSKIGFTSGAASCGNVDRTHTDAEIFLDQSEYNLVNSENGYLNTIYGLGITNKLDRTNSSGINAALAIYYDVAAEIPILAKEWTRLTEQIDSLSTILAETAQVDSVPSSHAHAMLMDGSDVTYRNYVNIAWPYANAIYPGWQGKGNPSGPGAWVLDLTDSTQIIRGIDSNGIGIAQPAISDTTINGQTTFILQAPHFYTGDDIRILDNTSSGNPSVRFNDNGFIVPGTWAGSDWNSYGYSVDNTATFTIGSYPLFAVKPDGTAVPGPLSYSVDTSAVRINYGPGPTDASVFFLNIYTTLGSLKTAINDMSGVDATGNSSYNSWTSRGIQIASGLISPDATLYLGLRECTVDYTTISDYILLSRIDYVTARKYQLTTRIPGLITREAEIRSDVKNEELFSGVDGSTGNIYNWADNRFNRGNGCEAKLVQINAMIERNRSALAISRRLMS